MNYTLSINGAAEQPLADLEIETFAVKNVNKGSDQLVLTTAPQDLNALPAIGYNNTVDLFQDGTRIFSGLCTTNPMQGLPGRTERRQFLVENIIYSLSRVVYEQDWHEDDTNTYFKGRVILGKDINSARITVGAGIDDIIGFANTQGVIINTEPADLAALTLVPPDTERVDLACWEAIRNYLYWAPDIATWIDYTTATPTLRFTARSAAPAFDIDYLNINGLTIAPRNDLLASGVVITYEQVHEAGGGQWTTFIQDSAGATTGTDVIKQTIDLQGISSSFSEQKVDVVVDTLADSTTTAFWETYLPGMADMTGLVINSGTNPPELATHPNILLAGHVADWMGVTWATGTFAANITGTLNGVEYKDTPVFVELTLTDAVTKTYKQIVSSSYRPAETPPANLAANLFAARSVLHYQGTITTQTNDPSFLLNSGGVINITNGETAWASMSAVIESITHTKTPKNNITTIAIGPPRHLEPQDFIEQIRATREIITSSWTRDEPASEDGSAIGTGGGTPNNNASTYPPGIPSNLPDPLLGNMLVGNGTTYELIAPGADKTMLRSNGVGPSYDVSIEDGTANGQIMVWDTSLGGVGGIKAESLPIGNDAIVLQSSTGTISFMQGSSSIPFYDSTGQPQLVSIPTTAGLLYHNGAGVFTAVPIPASGLLTGSTTSIGSESYLVSGGYFTQ